MLQECETKMILSWSGVSVMNSLWWEVDVVAMLRVAKATIWLAAYSAILICRRASGLS